MAKKFVLTSVIDFKINKTTLNAAKQAVQSALQGIKVNAQVNAQVNQINKNLQGAAKSAKTLTSNLGGVASNKVAQANKQVQQLNAGLKTTATTSAQAVTQMQKFGDSAALAIKRYGAFTISTVGFINLISAIKNATKDAIEFDREIIRISQVTGTATKDLKGLKTEITRLSTELGVSSTDLAKVAVTISQAGYSANETKQALEALAKTELSATFGDIHDTTEASIAIMKQFNIETKDLKSTLSSINRVSAAFAVESDDITVAVQKAGGAFAAAGGSLDEFVALFTSVRQTTRESAESIATGLRTIFTRIQRPKTIELLKSYGVELRNLEGEFVGPFEATKRLNDVISGLSTKSDAFARISEELGGYRQISKTVPLIQQFAIAQKALNIAKSAGNSLDSDAVKAQEAVLVQLKKLREEFLATVRAFGDNAYIREMIGMMINLARSIVQVTKALEPVIPMMMLIGGFKIGKVGQQFFGTGKFSNSGFFPRLFSSSPDKHFASGGMVPGTGSGDTVPAMLTPGEVVMNKKAVAAIGASNLNRANRIQKFAGGGLVRQTAMGAIGASLAGQYMGSTALGDIGGTLAQISVLALMLDSLKGSFSEVAQSAAVAATTTQQVAKANKSMDMSLLSGPAYQPMPTAAQLGKKQSFTMDMFALSGGKGPPIPNYGPHPLPKPPQGMDTKKLFQSNSMAWKMEYFQRERDNNRIAIRENNIRHWNAMGQRHIDQLDRDDYKRARYLSYKKYASNPINILGRFGRGIGKGIGALEAKVPALLEKAAPRIMGGLLINGLGDAAINSSGLRDSVAQGKSGGFIAANTFKGVAAGAMMGSFAGVPGMVVGAIAGGIQQYFSSKKIAKELENAKIIENTASRIDTVLERYTRTANPEDIKRELEKNKASLKDREWRAYSGTGETVLGQISSYFTGRPTSTSYEADTLYSSDTEQRKRMVAKAFPEIQKFARTNDEEAVKKFAQEKFGIDLYKDASLLGITQKELQDSNKATRDSYKRLTVAQEQFMEDMQNLNKAFGALNQAGRASDEVIRSITGGLGGDVGFSNKSTLFDDAVKGRLSKTGMSEFDIVANRSTTLFGEAGKNLRDRAVSEAIISQGLPEYLNKLALQPQQDLMGEAETLFKNMFGHLPQSGPIFEKMATLFDNIGSVEGSVAQKFGITEMPGFIEKFQNEIAVTIPELEKFQNLQQEQNKKIRDLYNERLQIEMSVIDRLYDVNSIRERRFSAYSEGVGNRVSLNTRLGFASAETNRFGFASPRAAFTANMEARNILSNPNIEESVRVKNLMIIEKSTKALEAMSDSSKKLSALDDEIAREKAIRERGRNIALEYAFGDNETRRRMDKEFSHFNQFISSGFNINSVPMNQRSNIGNLLGQFGGDELINGKKVSDIQSMVINQAGLPNFQHPGGKEMSLINERDKTFKVMEDAASGLLKIQDLLGKFVDSGIVKSNEEFMKAIQESFPKDLGANLNGFGKGAGELAKALVNPGQFTHEVNAVVEFRIPGLDKIAGINKEAAEEMMVALVNKGIESLGNALSKNPDAQTAAQSAKLILRNKRNV